MEAAPAQTVRTVLIIDDDVSIQNLIGHLLRREGYNVVCANNGWDGLEYLRKNAAVPALILLDLRMPVMDGWKFRTEQRSDPRLARVPVVVITSVHTVEEDIQSVNAAAFLKKPIQVELLLRTVKNHCLAAETV